MKTLTCLIAILCLAVHTEGADLAWGDGTVWHDISFKDWDATTITLAHDGTQTRVRISRLPEETRIAVYMAQAESLRPTYENDPSYATAYAEFKKQGARFSGRWQQISTRHSALAMTFPEHAIPSSALVVGSVPADAVDDKPCDLWLWPAGRVRYVDVLGATRTVLRYATSPELAYTLRAVDPGL